MSDRVSSSAGISYALVAIALSVAAPPTFLYVLAQVADYDFNQMTVASEASAVAAALALSITAILLARRSRSTFPTATHGRALAGVAIVIAWSVFAATLLALVIVLPAIVTGGETHSGPLNRGILTSIAVP